MGIAVAHRLPVKGRFSFRTFDALTGKQHEERVAENVVVTGGLNILASAINWSMIQNQNAAWGSPYSAVNLGDVWGAVGINSTAAASGQSSLFAEVGRAIVTSGAISNNQIVLDFFFGVTQAVGSIIEVGAFTQGGSMPTQLTSTVTSGNSYSSINVGAVQLPPTGSAGPSAIGYVPIGAQLILGYGSAQTQVLTVSSTINDNDTVLHVNSFTANATYPAGTPVAYVYGTMIDRSVFGVSVVKTITETAILEVALTLISG